MRCSLVALGAWLGACLVAAPGAAWAQGYGVYEQSSCATGRGGAGVAAPCDDGSSVFYNPAGIVAAPTREISVGGTGIAPRGGFTNRFTGIETDLDSKVYPVPHGYLVWPFQLSGRKAAAAIGVFAPYGLTTDWPTTFEGRYLGYHSRIAGIYVQPTFAVEPLSWLRVGAGLDLSFFSVALNQRIDLSSQATPVPGVTFANLGIPYGTDFADAKLSGHATGVGYHLGVQIRALPELTLGARFLSRQLVKFNSGKIAITQIPTNLVLPANNPVSAQAGSTSPVPVDALLAAEFGTGGPLTDQAASTYLRVPEQFVVGAAWQATSRIRLLADAQYVNWTIFDTLHISAEKLGPITLPEDNGHTWGIRLGGEYAVSSATTLRAGYTTHNAASPPQSVIPNLPEGPRAEFSLGFGTRLGRAFGVDVGYTRVEQADRLGRTVALNPAVPLLQNNNGIYTFHANLLGITLRYGF